jgi:hypothetical protein
MSIPPRIDTLEIGPSQIYKTQSGRVDSADYVPRDTGAIATRPAKRGD